MRSYQETHKLYADNRAIAHFYAARKFEKKFPSLMLSNISSDVLEAYKRQWADDQRHDASRHWNWESIAASMNSNPKQFQVAIWNQRSDLSGHTKDLHGIAIGRTTRTGYAVQIEYIEAYPGVGIPFRGYVFPIVQATAVFYGFLIKARCVRIVDPLPAVTEYYQSRGFRIENGPVGKARLVMMLGESDG